MSGFLTRGLCLQAALHCFCAKSHLRSEGLTRDLVDRIPGKQTDRKTPMGELNWIFTAITDTIAWNVLPRALFQRLLRQVQGPQPSLSILSGISLICVDKSLGTVTCCMRTYSACYFMELPI